MAKVLLLLGLVALPYGEHALAAPAGCGLPTVTLPLKSYNLTLSDQPVFSWGVLVGVNGTQLCASPSTVVSSCLWEHENVCSAENLDISGMTARQCRSRRGNFLTTTGIVVASTADTDSLAAQNPNWVSLMNGLRPFNMATTSPLQIQADVEVPMLSGIIDRGFNHTNSHFALDDNSVVLRGFKDGGYTHALSFAIDSGSTSYLAPRSGSVTLGGYIPGKFDGPPVEYSMAAHNKKLLGRRCPLQASIVELVINAGNKSKTLVARDDQPLTSCIEP